ncbi:conserved hypothetical protein [Histoplasma capsulatum var. duboisii H88]|uniref:GAL4-like Zn2Cys6 binuclear cluster DNA-binding domain-containing protein n=1 Tax=Ajellomyces capsulatus (strain H88) TaxID=544711 RepID=F0UGX4_AJEC8|nr:conserved hypothetical protein [Histoplasma capsulatum var. duboisii H88]QSS55152.1 GAL4-like Zn2Cys6 binuclear cluster DNA-binding domain-containing protein [Histoplasma capsulatum var. duboisii H88]
MDHDGNRQIRAACDRCHSQKLRCERRQDEESCLRCARNATACVYSVRKRRTVLRPPRHRPKRRRLRNEDGESGSGGVNGQIEEDPFGGAVAEDVEDELDSTYLTSFDPAFGQWPELHELPQDMSVPECDDFSLPRFGNGLVESILPPPNQPLMPTPCSSGKTLTDWSQDIPGTLVDKPNMIVQQVRKLADLNVKLCEHAAKLPPVSTSFSEIQISLANRVFEIDETFCLIQTLLDVSRTIYSHRSIPSENQPLEDISSISPSILFSQNNQKDHPPNDTSPGARGGPGSHVPDRPTFLLILSCYDRVIDICQCIFTHIECCVKTFATPLTPEAQVTQLPELRIGSYKPPISSAVAMKMFLFHTMARQLLSQLRAIFVMHNTGAGREGWQWDTNGRGDGRNNYSNGNETGSSVKDTGRDTGIPEGPYTNVETTPLDLVDKNRHDIFARACGMSEQVTNIGKKLMDMAVVP